MTLTGTFTRNLDDKQRIAIPKRIRELLGGETIKTLFLSPGTEQSLSVYSPAEFERLTQRLDQVSTNRLEYRNYVRLLFGQSEEAELDSQGRIRIPERLVRHAQLERDVILVGVRDHLEIWSSIHWEAFLKRHEPQFDDMATRAYEST